MFLFFQNPARAIWGAT